MCVCVCVWQGVETYEITNLHTCSLNQFWTQGYFFVTLFRVIINTINITICSTHSWGTAVAQWLRCCATKGRSLVRFQIVSLECFIAIILPIALWPWGRPASNRNEYQEHFLGVKAAGA